MRFPTRNCVKNNDIPTQNDTKINGKIDEILIFYQNPQKMEISKKIFFRPIFLHFIKIFMAKILISCRCRFVSAFDSWYFQLSSTSMKNGTELGKKSFFPTVIPLGSTTLIKFCRGGSVLKELEKNYKCSVNVPKVCFGDCLGIVR